LGDKQKGHHYTLWSQKLINTAAAVISAGSVMAQVYYGFRSREEMEMEAHIEVVLGIMRPESASRIPEKRGHLSPNQPEAN
jgi:hypothetical protein